MSSRQPLQGLSEVRAAPREQFLRAADAQLPLALALVTYGVLYALLTLLRPFDADTFLALSDAGGVLPPIVAGVIALFAEERAVPHVTAGWRMIGAGCLAWGFGDLAWTYYEVVLDQPVPFPSMADAGYLAMLPLVALGLVVLSSERRRLSRSRPTLDGIAIVLSAVAFVWYFVLHPTYTQSDATVWQKVIGAAYPVGDLVIVYALVVAVQRQWDVRNAAIVAFLLAGMATLTAADLGFAYLTLQDRYDSTSLSSSLVNIGWPAGFLVIAYAAALGADWSLTYESDEALPTRSAWRHAVPLALLVPLFFLCGYSLAYDTLSVSVPLVAVAGLAAGALVLRLLISLGMLREIEAAQHQVATLIDDIRARRAA
jgi:hypothetical protein